MFTPTKNANIKIMDTTIFKEEFSELLRKHANDTRFTRFPNDYDDDDYVNFCYQNIHVFNAMTEFEKSHPELKDKLYWRYGMGWNEFDIGLTDRD